MICAVEAHTITACFVHRESLLMRTRRKVLSHDLDNFIKGSASELPANGIRQLTSRLRWRFKHYVEIVGTVHRDVSQQFTIRWLGDADPNEVAPQWSTTWKALRPRRSSKFTIKVRTALCFSSFVRSACSAMSLPFPTTSVSTSRAKWGRFR